MKKMCLLVLLLAGVCFGQNPFDFIFKRVVQEPNYFSTRAMSMGGVFTATNAGGESLFGNPAGLADVNSTQILYAGKVTSFSNYGFEDSYYVDRTKPDMEYSTEHNFRPDNLAISIPILKKGNLEALTGAIGYYNYYDIDREEKVSSYYHQSNSFIENVHANQGMLNVLALGIGVYTNERLSFGGVLNIPLNTRFNSEHDYYQKFPDADASLSNSSINRNTYDVHSNPFVHLGVRFMATSRLNLGATLTFGHSLYFRNGENYRSQTGEFYGDDFSQTTNPDDFQWKIPALWTLGASYRIAPPILVAVDLQNRPWKEFVVSKTSYLWNDVVNNGTAVRFGAELGTKFKLRVGCFDDILPLQDYNEKAVHRIGFTGGFGIPVGALTFDSGLLYHRIRYDMETSLYHLGNNDYTDEYYINELFFYGSLTYGFDFAFGK